MRCTLLILFAIAFLIPNPRREPNSPASVASRRGMVASSRAIASQVGADILKSGGNAVDAAVAVALALAVTLPAAGTLGGGGFMLIRAAGGRTGAIDYREVAPAAATRDMYLDGTGKLVPRATLDGYRAAAAGATSR